MTTPQHPAPLRHYLVTATAPNGKRQTREVHADSASEAVRTLEAGGYTGVVLHTDDTVRLPSAPQVKMKPHELLDMLAYHPDKVWRVRLKMMWRRNKALFIWPPIWTLVLVLLWSMRGFRPFDLLMIAFILIPVAGLAWLLLMPDPVAPYNRVLQAGVEGRYEEVLQRLPEAERAMRRLPAGGRDLELARLRAAALVRLGRVDEGIAALEQLRTRPDVDQIQLGGIMGDTYCAARDFDSAEVEFRELVEAAPQNPATWMMLAEFLVKHRIDPAGAADALACIDDHAITPQTATGIRFVRGMIELESRHDREAAELLRGAVAEIGKMGEGNPIVRVLVAFGSGYLAVAEARLGDRSGGAARWAAAWPLLSLHAPDRLRQLGREYFQSVPVGAAIAAT